MQWKLLSLFFMYTCIAAVMCDNPVVINQEECITTIEKDCCNCIDALFVHAHESIAKGENIMTVEWLSKQEELKALRNILSDATITLEFDQQITHDIPLRLQTYLDNKIRQEIPQLFEIYKISVKDVDNFYELSRIICELSQGQHCARMMQHIQEDHLAELLKLKMQKEARAYLRKQEARELRRSLIFGTRGRIQ